VSDKNPLAVMAVWVLCIGMCLGLVGGGCYAYPQYNVWQQKLAGQAELARAAQNRQIKIQEAQATADAATSLAVAEVARARGVAEANQIVQEGLGGPEGYLRYLYIEGLKDHTERGCPVIYVPTEAGLPILEAGQR
jgi:regulator of protease activity HflC (stomatin/prohibitin superfamily)